MRVGGRTNTRPGGDPSADSFPAPGGPAPGPAMMTPDLAVGRRDRVGGEGSAMSEPRATERRRPGVVAAGLTAALAVSAALSMGYRVSLAISPEDTEASESPQVLAVARQITVGPGGLYGPFGGRNPFVLIHAPLYYRLAALLAWPLNRAGLDPVTSSLAAGRGLSFVSLLAALYAAGRLARLGDAPRAAGWWAVLLIASSPVLDGLPVTVLPDMLGVALQTSGILMALSALEPERRSRARVLAAYAAFGLALCVKQTYVVAPAICTALLVAARVRGRLPSRAVGQGVVLALAVVGAVYGADWVVTGGRTFEPVFVIAGGLARLRPANWGRAGGPPPLCEVAILEPRVDRRCLTASPGLRRSPARPGRVRGAGAAVGAAVVIGTLAVYAVWGRERWYDLFRLVGVAAALLAVFVGSALAEPKGVLGGRADAALWACWAGEFARRCRSSGRAPGPGRTTPCRPWSSARS